MPKLIAPDDFSWVAPLARGADKGEEVDVDDELVDGLVAQGWKAADDKTAGKAKAAKPTTDAPPAPNEEQ